MDNDDLFETEDRLTVDEYAKAAVCRELNIQETRVDPCGYRTKWGLKRKTAVKGSYYAKQKEYDKNQIRFTCTFRVLAGRKTKALRPKEAEYARYLLTGFNTPPTPLYRYEVVCKEGNGAFTVVQQMRTLPQFEYEDDAVLWLMETTIGVSRMKFKGMVQGLEMMEGGWERCFPKYWSRHRGKLPFNLCDCTGEEPVFAHAEDRYRHRAFLFVHGVVMDAERREMGNAMRADMMDYDKMAEYSGRPEHYKLTSAVFARHPEVVRFYGGLAFSRLEHCFTKEWLMGLHLREVYNLNEAMENRPFNLVWFRETDALFSRRHKLDSHGHNPLQRAISLAAYAEIYTPKGAEVEHLAAVVLGVLREMCGGELGMHRVCYCHELYAEASRYIQDEMRGPAPTLLLFAQAVETLANVERVMVVPPAQYPMGTGAAILIGKAQVSDSETTEYMQDARITTWDIYYEDLVLSTSLQNIMLRSVKPGARLRDLDYRYTIPERTCSEQMSVLAATCMYPLVNVCGRPGSGKTGALLELVALYGPQHVLCIAALNSHLMNLVGSLGEKLKEHGFDPSSIRYSTAHGLVEKHQYACTHCIPQLKTKPGKMNWLKLRNNVMDKLEEKRNARTTESEYVDYLDALYNYPFTDCMLEDIHVLVVEEASLISQKLLGLILWILFRCAPQCVVIVLVGDPDQLASLLSGCAFKDIIDAFPQFTIRFVHSHRACNPTFADNVDAIRCVRPKEVRFDDDCFQLEACSSRTYADVVQDVLRTQRLKYHNCQIITRTNMIRKTLAPLALRLLLDRPNVVPGAYYRRQSIMPKRNQPPLVCNMMLEIIAVVYVALEPVAHANVEEVNPNPDVDEWVSEQVSDVTYRATLLGAGLSARQCACVLNDSFVQPGVDMTDVEQDKRLFDAIEHVLSGGGTLAGWCREHGRNRLTMNLSAGAANSIVYAMSENDGSASKFDFVVEQIEASTAARVHDYAGTSAVFVCREKTFSTRGVAYNPSQFPAMGLYKVPWLKGQKHYVTDATVVTCHSMMGHQAPNIVVVQPTKSEYATNEWMYTAVTRAEERVTCVMSKEVFQTACMRPEPDREGLLAQFLEPAKEKMAEMRLSAPWSNALYLCALMEACEGTAYLRSNKSSRTRFQSASAERYNMSALSKQITALVRNLSDRKPITNATRYRAIQQYISAEDAEAFTCILTTCDDPEAFAKHTPSAAAKEQVRKKGTVPEKRAACDEALLARESKRMAKSMLGKPFASGEGDSDVDTEALTRTMENNVYVKKEKEREGVVMM